MIDQTLRAAISAAIEGSSSLRSVMKLLEYREETTSLRLGPVYRVEVWFSGIKWEIMKTPEFHF